MNRFWKFISKWGFPLAIGGAYWLFDTAVDYINPAVKAPSLREALLPALIGTEITFRGIMTAISIFGAKYFESTMQRVRRLEQQLYLNEFAVEHTKAFAMMWTNANGQIIKVNQYAASRLGYTKSELLAMSLFDITVDHTKEVWDKLLSKLKKQGSLTYVAKQRRKDGTLVDAIMYLQYLKVKTDQYHFAFVCDAFHCPTGAGGNSPCGRPSTPTLDQLLLD